MEQKDSTKRTTGIIDDDPVVRCYLESLLSKQSEVTSVLMWESAEAFFDSERRNEVDLLLVDLELPGEDGVQVLKRMQLESPDTVCIVLTSSSRPEDVFAAIRAGASGYLMKQTAPALLAQNLQAVVHDGMTFSPSIAKLVVQAFLKADAQTASQAQSGIEHLTERELEVLELMQQLGNAKTVASRLQLSHETIRAHLKKIYQKLHVSSKSAAVEMLMQSRV